MSSKLIVLAFQSRPQFDVVVNHVAAQTTTTFAPDAATYGPLDAASDYHPFCFISDYNNQTDVEQCESLRTRERTK